MAASSRPTGSRSSVWYKNAVFYQIYVRAFSDSNADGQGDLRGVIDRLDYLQDLGVDCLWLMPTYPSPLKDDGYDIADYCGVHSDYGSLDDFRALLDEAHRRGLRVITDLVLNHTSDEHPWFQAARADRSSPYRNYYVWSDTDRKYAEARIIFLDTEPSNWTYDSTAGQYYWHRFYACQPDLNYDNPAVRAEMLKAISFWLDLGVDGFRADAVPYLFEREGTNGENLPETHAYLKELRSYIDEHYPGRILLCEANQWPEDVRPYFGDGDEFQLGFHFPIMPRIFMALKKGVADDMIAILERTPAIPENCQWCVFLRNHDELTLEMVTEAERQWMWREYAPDPRMKLNLGIRRRLAPLLDNDRRKIELANSILFTLPGSPIIYYGDELGMGDNISLPDRNGVRTPMQWTAGASAGFSASPSGKLYAPVIERPGYDPSQVSVEVEKADPGSLLNAIRRMIALRKQHEILGWGDFHWVDAGNRAVASYVRRRGGQSFLVLNNLSDSPQEIKPPADLQRRYLDAFSGEESEVGPTLTLGPYGYIWLSAA
jgi:maltose alpha-D-glucosyltransferase/alpha-amylase